MTGRELFACYAFPPNELGYCGPADTTQAELASHAKEFDGAWPYLQAIADAAGIADPLDDGVVRNYWVGGPLLDKVDPDELLAPPEKRIHRTGHRHARRHHAPGTRWPITAFMSLSSIRG